MEVPPKYEYKEAKAAKWALLQSIPWPPTEVSSAQGRPSTIKKPSSKPFRAALVMSCTSESYNDSKGALQPSKRLKVKCGSTMIYRNTTETGFRRLIWECIYDTFKPHGWIRTDAKLASGKKFATADEWEATIAHLVEKDAGQHPFLRFSFSFQNGERVKLETESKLSFSLKQMFDRVMHNRRS